MKQILIGIAIGIIAGLIDVIPMLIKKVGRKECLSAFVHYAVVEEWDLSVQKLMEAYRDVDVVIPGHGRYGTADLMLHTVDLVKRWKEKL